MAWEAPGQIVSFPTTSTGLARYSYVNISTGGNIIYTVASGSAIGVLQEGSTGSTVPPTALPVMISGISKVRTTAESTIGVGEIIAVTSKGTPKTIVAAAPGVGKVVAGASGAANRFLSVLLQPIGHSTAFI